MQKYIDLFWIGLITTWADYILPFVIPIQGYLIFMICAILSDTITGVIAAMKENNKLTSKGIWRTIEKIVVAGIAILISEGFRVNFLPDIPLTQGVASIIAFAEVKSIFENYYRITGHDIGTVLIETVKDRIITPTINTVRNEDKSERH